MEIDLLSRAQMIQSVRTHKIRARRCRTYCVRSSRHVSDTPQDFETYTGRANGQSPRMTPWTAPTLRHRCAKGGCVKANYYEGSRPWGMLSRLVSILRSQSSRCRRRVGRHSSSTAMRRLRARAPKSSPWQLCQILPKGKLSLHGEFPDEVVSVIRPFLSRGSSPLPPGCVPWLTR